MKPGDIIYQIHTRPFGYQIRIPCPPTLPNCENHVQQIEPPALREDMDIVELEVKSVRKAGDTDRCPAPDGCEEMDREARGELPTLPGTEAAE